MNEQELQNNSYINKIGTDYKRVNESIDYILKDIESKKSELDEYIKGKHAILDQLYDRRREIENVCLACNPNYENGVLIK